MNEKKRAIEKRWVKEKQNRINGDIHFSRNY